MREPSKLNLVAPATDRKQDIYATPAERVKLLRRGIPGTKIEKMYIEANSILILGTDWQDSHESGTLLVTTPITPQSRHVSSPVSPCAVELRA